MNPLDALTEAPPHVHDRRLNLLLGAAVVTAVGMLIFAVIAVPKIVDSSRATTAIARSSEIGGCRATFRAQVDQSVAGVLVAKSRLDEATNEGFELTVSRRAPELVALLPTLPPLRAELEEAVKALEDANRRNVAAVELSIADEGAFLELCSPVGKDTTP